jgi:hypothetical protein
MGQQLDGSSDALYRPMSWEAWHVQLTGSREMPGEETGPPDEETSTEPSEEDLEAHGITMDDIDASVARLLERLDQPNDEQTEEDAEAIDDGYDPQSATGAVEEQAGAVR